MQIVAQRSTRVMVAMTGGVMAAAAGALLWFVVAWTFNVHASFLAALVGPFAAMAAWLIHNRTGSRLLQGWSVLVTLLAMLAAEAMVVRMIAVRGLEGQGEVAVLLPFGVMWDLISTGITQDPITPLFFAVSLWYAISIPRPRDDDF
jgi:hypothetical protein